MRYSASPAGPRRSGEELRLRGIMRIDHESNAVAPAYTGRKVNNVGGEARIAICDRYMTFRTVQAANPIAWAVGEMRDRLRSRVLLESAYRTRPRRINFRLVMNLRLLTLSQSVMCLLS
jgi:hypothetical protein